MQLSENTVQSTLNAVRAALDLGQIIEVRMTEKGGEFTAWTYQAIDGPGEPEIVMREIEGKGEETGKIASRLVWESIDLALGDIECHLTTPGEWYLRLSNLSTKYALDFDWRG